MARTQITCKCGKLASNAGRGLCNKCYKREPDILALNKIKQEEYRKINSDKRRKYALQRYHVNSKFLNAQQQVRRQSPEGAAVRRATRLADYKANPQKYIARILKRRCLELSVPGSHTEQEWQDRLREFNWCCAFCLKPDDNLTREHMTPLSWGHMSSNDISNIIPACVSCNSSKCGKNLLTFAPHQSMRA